MEIVRFLTRSSLPAERAKVKAREDVEAREEVEEVDVGSWW
jgi:hypothetical protein